GGRQAMLGEEVGMEEGELDGIGDLFDQVVETSDVLVVDIGHLLENKLLHLGASQLLKEKAGAWIGEDGVTGPHPLVGQRLGQLTDPLVVGSADDERTILAEDVANGHHLPGSLTSSAEDDAERLVERDLVAPPQLLDRLRRSLDTHLSAPGMNVDGAVVVHLQDRPVRTRWAGELLDL